MLSKTSKLGPLQGTPTINEGFDISTAAPESCRVAHSCSALQLSHFPPTPSLTPLSVPLTTLGAPSSHPPFPTRVICTTKQNAGTSRSGASSPVVRAQAPAHPVNLPRCIVCVYLLLLDGFTSRNSSHLCRSSSVSPPPLLWIKGASASSLCRDAT